MNYIPMKKLGQMLVCAAVVTCITHSASANAINAKALQILAQSARTYSALQSYQDSSINVDDSPAGKFVLRQIISFKAPRYMNVATMHGKDHLVQNYDGHYYNSTNFSDNGLFWTKLPLPDASYGRRVLLQYQPADALFTPFLAGVVPLSSPFGMALSSLKFGPVTTLDHVKVNTIIATPEDESKTQFVYLIGQKDHLVRRITINGKTVAGDKYTTSETHSNIKINQPFPIGTFKFHVPKGAAFQNIMEEMPAETLQKGVRAPYFHALNLHNKNINLKQYKGKILLLDFWATWCVTCREEMPFLQALYQKYHAQGLEIVGVSQDMRRPALQAYVKEHHIPWPQIWDSAFAISLDYKADALPSNALIDATGKIVAVNQRMFLLDTAIRKALKK